MAEETPPQGVDLEGIETEIVSVDPRDIVLLELNARYMKPETFRRLVENVKRDGVLTQLPFCVREEGRLKVLSGNHRVQAAIEAGLERIEVLVSKTELTPDRQRAIQLSHNAIAGEDDPLMLRRLFDEIADTALKAYSGLDDKTLELLAKSATPPMGAQGLDVATLTLTFLPGQKERMAEALREAVGKVKGEAWLAPFELYDATADMLDTVSLACEVRSMAVAFAHLLDVHSRHLGELKPELKKPGGDFPLAVLFERAEVPREEARQVAKALERYAEDPWDALLVVMEGSTTTRKTRAKH